MARSQVLEAGYNSRVARILRAINLDPILFLGLVLLTVAGLGILYSAGDGSISLVKAQLVRLGLAFLVIVEVERFTLLLKLVASSTR